MDKSTKLSVCLGFALAGWLIPASMPLPKPLQGISLGFALTASLAGATESKRETVRQRFARTERDQEFEYLATEQIIRHEQRLKQLYQELGFRDAEYDDRSDYDRYAEYHQPQLDGATIDQKTIVGSGNESIQPWESLRPDLEKYFCILIHGSAGTGKTTLVEWLITQRLNAGHRVIVLDPHREHGQWERCEVIGDGKDYTAIDAQLLAVLEEVNERYRQRSKARGLKFSPLTIVCEELSMWAANCKNVAPFLLSALADFRKIGINLILVSHGKTNELFGGAKGTHATREATLLEVNPLGKSDPTAPEGVRPRGIALVKLPGQSPRLFAIPNLTAPNTAPNTAPSTTPPPGAPSNPNNGTIASLTRCLDAPVATELHWKIVDFAIAQKRAVSVREVMRGCGIKTAEECKAVLLSLQALELGELQREGDRILFSPYPPLS